MLFIKKKKQKTNQKELKIHKFISKNSSKYNNKQFNNKKQFIKTNNK